MSPSSQVTAVPWPLYLSLLVPLALFSPVMRHRFLPSPIPPPTHTCCLRWTVTRFRPGWWIVTMRHGLGEPRVCRLNRPIYLPFETFILFFIYFVVTYFATSTPLPPTVRMHALRSGSRQEPPELPPTRNRTFVKKRALGLHEFFVFPICR